MNKLMTAAVIAGGLMLLNSPEAAAHKEVRNVYQPPAHYAHIDVRRPQHMPRWLKRNKGFRHWYRHTSLKRDRRLAWHQLFDIYRFERRFGHRYYRGADYWNDYYAPRYGERHFDRGHRDKPRHRKHRH